MPRNGSGTYVLTAGQPVVSGTTISSTVFNTLTTDIGNEITKSICTDGQTPMTANLPMGNNRITGLAAGVAASDAARFDQITAAQAAALPTAGGTMTGALVMSNAIQIQYKDSGGTNRQLVTLAADNTLNWTVPGGVSWNIYNQAGGTLLWSISNTGAVNMTSTLTMNNTVGINLKDSSNNIRSFVSLGADNNQYHTVTGGQNIRWYNQAFTTELMTLTNAGALSAITVTQTSDARKKENWKALTDAQLDALARMKHAGTFDWVDGSGPSVGGSAQEIWEIVPEAVAIADDEQKSLSVNYGGLNFAILQAMLRRQKANV